jgi:hypothetical protein
MESTNSIFDIAEVLSKVVLNTIKPNQANLLVLFYLALDKAPI